MSPQTFTLPWPPTVNRLTAIVRGRKVKTAAMREYAQRAGLVALEHGVRPIREGDVTLRLVFYRPTKTGDLDNRLKAVLDCITGIAYSDDKQVRRIEADREEDPSNPRVLVTVQQWEAIP